MRYFIIVVLLVVSSNITAQKLKTGSLVAVYNQKSEVKGIVLDAENEGEPLYFAEVTVKELNKTVETEIDGSFKLSLKPGEYTLVYSFIGYETVEIQNVKIQGGNVLKLKQVLKASKPDTPNLNTVAFFSSK
ncbi:carboxypeptidase-like regulatory domain-containing protein [Lutibacter citreus]|uniref:carboxypeptidase-like regulatory domain-containing protein n=1 Tax=Lutibacter citreus TaxID=2138210 RepID=UPI0013008F23|nr:carboxypeptidase-like regulatory domain-containing protein [Lutibacter citreus]